MLNFDEFYRIMRRRGDPLDDFDSDDEWEMQWYNQTFYFEIFSTLYYEFNI